MNSVKKMVTSSLFIALGVVLGKFNIQIGISKCFPMQHLINVLSAVLLGPFYAVMNAFLISLLRNILGLGSILAFPGSMIGAFLSAMLYKNYKNIYFASLGELIGTGILGSLLAFPIAKLLMGSDKGAFFFVIPFLISSLSGVIIATILLKFTPIKKTLLRFLDE